MSQATAEYQPIPQTYQPTYTDVAYRSRKMDGDSIGPPHMQQSHHVLYYSNYCSYSMAVCDAIARTGLVDLFYGVCVDHSPSEIPSFVECVPTVLTTDRRVLVDDSVRLFVESMRSGATVHGSAGAKNTRNGAAEDADNLQGFSVTTAFSDSFAVLDTCGEFTSDDHHSFEAIYDTPGPQMLQQSSNTTMTTTKPSRMDVKEMENYLMNRDRDTEFAKRSQSSGPAVQPWTAGPIPT